eukprot:COSAG02_NODE_214_length_28689_cov_34.895523_14_plen_157_part_00
MTCADKSLFERPPELYGTFGEAARRATREDQYPETGRFGEYTGSRWREVFNYNGVLPQESVDHGMKNICPKAGDVLIMPEVRLMVTLYVILGRQRYRQPRALCSGVYAYRACPPTLADCNCDCAFCIGPHTWCIAVAAHQPRAIRDVDDHHSKRSR